MLYIHRHFLRSYKTLKPSCVHLSAPVHLRHSSSSARRTVTQRYAMEWLGHANVDYTTAKSSRNITLKDGSATSLLELSKEITPPCSLNPLLFNGHIQTMWTATRQEGPPVYYRRRLFTAEQKAYEGTFAVDFVVDQHDESDETLSERTVFYTDEQWADREKGTDDSKPMLIILHGLSGGSHEIYLRHAIAPLVDSKKWEICVVNARGCANSKITSGVLYNARATWDVRQVINWCSKTYPNRPLFGMGFSLGANMLTNYCGEEGSNCILKAAVVVSNPYNLEVASKVMQGRLLSREVYLRVLGGAMKKLVARHKDDLEKQTNLNMSAIENVTYLHEFDREIQCPIWGYPTEDAYYRDASSSDAVCSIRIPFLAISATDDPISVKEAIPFEEFKQNPNTVLLTTSLGGHLCWFENGGSRWYPKPINNFFEYFASKVDLCAVKASDEPLTYGIMDRKTKYEPMRRKMGMAGQS